MVMHSNKYCVASYVQFFEYWGFYYPNLKCTRLQSDACNSCVRIDIALKDPNISDDDHAELQIQKICI